MTTNKTDAGNGSGGTPSIGRSIPGVVLAWFGVLLGLAGTLCIVRGSGMFLEVLGAVCLLGAVAAGFVSLRLIHGMWKPGRESYTPAVIAISVGAVWIALIGLFVLSSQLIEFVGDYYRKHYD
jgi:hypothetical protein